uniref:Helicase ATP-binding domain-containing protein n=1 Tax=viral metagenome TaxID=1070528 RepID=A0A6C0C7I4_9ZZZZ
MERKHIEYDMKQLEDMHDQKTIINSQMNIKERNGINVIYDNQSRCSTIIVSRLEDRKIINILVYGKTQTGKTGCMTSLIRQYIFKYNIPIENIYIITGLSDKAWKDDTIERMPDLIRKRIYHRANLPKTFVNEIKSKRNVLIIMDEIQIACEEDQTIHKTFKECGFYNLDYLLNNDIKLIQFSATPDGNLNDINDWRDHSLKVKLEPGEAYIGTKELINKNRLFQYKDLMDINNVEEILPVINERYINYMYHLIRVPNKLKDKQGKVIRNFKEVFGDNFDYNIDYLKTKKEDINKLLKIKPEKHTFVFYCEILRCAKTQHKEFIGISYERYNIKPNDSSILQGSVGRLTGHDDNGLSICYTNINSILMFEKLWDNDFEFIEGIIWNTKTTNYDEKTNKTNSTGTFNGTNNIVGMEGNSTQPIKQDRGDPNIEKFNTQKAMKQWFKGNLKSIMIRKTGPNTKKPDENGFYKGSIRHGLEILSQEEVDREKRWGFGNGPGARSYPCYSDINDPKTLQWWLIYYLN